MRVVLVCVAALFTSCTSVHLQLGAGYDKYLDQGSNPRSLIGIVARKEGCSTDFPSVVCIGEYRHNSSYKDGWPWNRNPEDLTNQWSLGVEIPLWKSR